MAARVRLPGPVVQVPLQELCAPGPPPLRCARAAQVRGRVRLSRKRPDDIPCGVYRVSQLPPRRQGLGQSRGSSSEKSG